jgi:predicted secreted protein
MAHGTPLAKRKKEAFYTFSLSRLRIFHFYKKEYQRVRNLKSLRITLLFFICLFLLSTPSFQVLAGVGINGSADNQGMMTVTNKNNGQDIEMKKGQAFRIELSQLGSAGYSWFMEKLDPEYLELVSNETRPIDQDRVGGPVLAVWVFRAKKTGQTEVVMDHYRVWEGKNKAINHFAIRLLIK